MKVAVVGLWHLGLVTAACLASSGHAITAYDPDPLLVENLKNRITPIFEPGLDDLLNANSLQYSNDPAAIADAEIVWINFDTPVDDNDNADIHFVKSAVEKLVAYCGLNTLILISSQLPVGSTSQIAQYCAQAFPAKNLRFGYLPENLRLGKALKIFMQPDRIVVGLQDQADKDLIIKLLGQYTDNFVWMSVASAEMTKHALNAFLALSVTFINEIATLCEAVGADAREVEAGLKSEERIGTKAYLKPGGAIAGGTLLRDIHYLNNIGMSHQHPVPLIASVVSSNNYHKDWVQRKLLTMLESLTNKTITILGLTYKINTNTLRRSSAIETCEWLHAQGVTINAYDPAIQSLPVEYSGFINLKNTIDDALSIADAVVIATEWPDFRNISSETFLQQVTRPLIFDCSGFLRATLGSDARIQYCTVGG